MTTGPAAVSRDALVDPALAGLPERIADPAAAIAGTPVVVILDDDPTGTQTVRDVPVLTGWGEEELRWALRQGRPGFFVLTNTRSLDPSDAAERVRAIARAARAAAEAEGVDIVFASRGDSTLRGHFPLETDVLRAEEQAGGHRVDAVLLVPAYLDAGRITVDGVHWVVDRAGRTIPVADSEFARDATFGFASSTLPDWVAEKTGGAVPADAVQVLDLASLRRDDLAKIAARLAGLSEGTVVAIDAERDDDLRVAAAAVAGAERDGSRFLYRTGPSFVRARLGQDSSAPVEASVLRAGRREDAAAHGLVVVGSHVGLTTRQLDGLRSSRPILELELDVARADDAGHRADLVDRAVAGLAERTVVLRTSRTVRTGADREASLAIARAVSAAVVDVVRGVLDRAAPAFLVAKGGITSSDVATEALGLRRAWVEGPMLPGIVSVWRAVDGRRPGMPYVVFAGNVGDDDTLAAVVDRLEAATT
ncbi:four-carbon acid sugar kinase family protein [Pseudolysinimonas sp.]|uniref:four-carbon acid sugar kinase family protein n=1 Tax=Pseudolysinimonas sp. TaxID=2680009 RepID=UPI003F7EBE25